VIFLRLDVVDGLAAFGGGVLDKLENRDEMDGGAVEGDEPYPEELVHADVEEKGGFVEGNTFDCQFNLRTQDLVPAENTPDKPAGAIEGACAAEGVCERSCGREVSFNCLTLQRRPGLCEQVDYLGDFSGWVFHD